MVDGNCPEWLLRELLDGLFGNQLNLPSQRMVVVVEVRRVDRMH